MKLEEAKIELCLQVRAEDLNGYGVMHGGVLLRLADEIGFLAAKLIYSEKCVTVAVHQARFFQPVAPRSRLLVVAEVGLTTTSSIWVRVQFYKLENTDEPAMRAFVVYVAINDLGQPTQLDPCVPTTPAGHALQTITKRLYSQAKDAGL